MSYVEEILTHHQRKYMAEVMWHALAEGTPSQRLELKRKIFAFFEVYLGE